MTYIMGFIEALPEAFIGIALWLLAIIATSYVDVVMGVVK